MELTAQQLLIVGAVTSLVVQLLRLLAAKVQRPLSDKVVLVVVFVVSLLLAFVFSSKTFTITAEDPMTLATDLLVAAGGVFALAVVIYKIILKEVFDTFGMKPAKPPFTVGKIN